MRTEIRLFCLKLIYFLLVFASTFGNGNLNEANNRVQHIIDWRLLYAASALERLYRGEATQHIKMR